MYDYDWQRSVRGGRRVMTDIEKLVRIKSMLHELSMLKELGGVVGYISSPREVYAAAQDLEDYIRRLRREGRREVK